jgi:hypothetical protein
MKNISPATQAVWDAAWTNCPVQCGNIEGTRRLQIAAALRAAAKQLRDPYPSDQLATFEELQSQLFAIANELDVNYAMNEYSEGPLSEFNDGGMPLG